MLQKVLFTVLVLLIELRVLEVDALCKLDVSKFMNDQRTWTNVTSACCGNLHVLKLSNRALYHCLDNCYTMLGCTTVYFDTASNECLLFDVEDQQLLINYKYMNEAEPNSPAFMVSLNRTQFQEMVRRFI